MHINQYLLHWFYKCRYTIQGACRKGKKPIKVKIEGENKGE